MNPKENAIEIIRFGHPEKIPVCMPGSLPGTQVDYFGANLEGFDAPNAEKNIPVGGDWIDIFGVRWEKEYEGIMGFPKGNPLADLPRALKTYQFPNPDDERLCGPIYQKVKEADRANNFIMGSHRSTLWERAYMLVGMENLMCYMSDEKEAVKELMHRIMDFDLGIAKHYLNVGVEIANLGDDLGTQNGLLLSPQMVEEFLVPEYKRLIGQYQSRNVIINFHSCGHVIPLLETLISLEVNILNTIQASANDLAEVRRITQGRMALMGGVSSGLIASGPKEAIRQEVKRCLWLLGRNGGYFCSPDQYMPWPPEHWDAFVKTVEEWGTYPLRERGE